MLLMLHNNKLNLEGNAMNPIKLLISMVIIGSTLLTGCSSKTKIEQLSTDIEALNTKVDQIGNDIIAIRTDVNSTKDDAGPANQRLDNQIQDDKK